VGIIQLTSMPRPMDSNLTATRPRLPDRPCHLGYNLPNTIIHLQANITSPENVAPFISYASIQSGRIVSDLVLGLSYFRTLVRPTLLFSLLAPLFLQYHTSLVRQNARFYFASRTFPARPRWPMAPLPCSNHSDSTCFTYSFYPENLTIRSS